MCIEAGHTAVCLAAIACILFAYNLPVYGRQEFHIPSPLSTPPSLFAFAVRACVKGEEEGEGTSILVYVYLLFVFIDFQVKTLLRSANCPICV